MLPGPWKEVIKKQLKVELPIRNKSTREVLERVIDVNENHLPLNEETEFVFPDIEHIYPNIDVEPALESVERRLKTKPSPSVDMSPLYTKEGLRVCLTCNTVKFKDKYYQPIRGVAMGSCHACDFSDIWVVDLVQKFSIYRDDGLDLLLHGERDIQEYKNHLNPLHQNIKFDIRHGKEGEHLDMLLMLKEK